MAELVRVDVEDSVARLTLSRREARNALSVDLCDAIFDALADIDKTSGARVVLLRGDGPAFCSGADFAAVSGAGALEFLSAFERMLEAVARFRLPVVAAIHGAALGGGLQLATVCDFRIATDSSKLGIPAARLGIVVNFENVQRLVLMAGIAVAKEVLMTGRVYSGSEAAAAGLVMRSVSENDLDAEARRLCETLASNAPLSVQGSKRAIAAVADDIAAARARSPETVADVDRLVVEAYNSEDLGEGLSAMSEKRPPRFRGR